MGREELLIETLQSISELNYSEFSVNTVIVSKNEHISEQLSNFSNKLDLQIIQVASEVTISDQRNIGVQNTNSEFLAFIDADIALSENWLSVMYEKLSQSNRVLISAIQEPNKNPTQLELVRVTLSNLHVDCNMEFLPGRNLFLRRQTFVDAGGFPSHLVTCEDYVFTQNVGKHGAMYYTSQAKYIHLGEDKEYWAMARKEIWRGQSNLASIKGRHVPLSEYPSFLAPPLFTFAVIGSLFAYLLGWNMILTLTIFIWAFLLSIYSFRLYKKRHKYLRLFPIIAFYCLYFPARTIGTILGAKTTFKTGDY